MTPQELKNSILQLAFTGRLTKLLNNKTDFTIYKTNNISLFVPAKWKWKPLGTISEIYTGNSISTTEKKLKYQGLKEGYDYIGTKDVGFDQVINYDNGIKIPFETSFKIAKKSSVLLCIEGGSAGRKIGIIDKDVCFGNKLCSFYSNAIFNKFIFYYLQSPLFKNEFSSNISGIIGGVSINKLKTIMIPIPDYNEQKLIVKKIEQLLPLVDEYSKAERKLIDINNTFPIKIKKSVLQYAVEGKLVLQDPNDEPASILLEKIKNEKEKLIKAKKIKRNKNESFIFRKGDSFYEKIGNEEKCIDDEIPFDIPDSWEWCRLGKILEKLTDGAHMTPKYINNGVPFLSVKDISSGEIKLDNCKYISFEEHKRLYARCNPEYGDILLTKVGTTGIPVIVNTKKEFSLFVSVALLKFNKNCLYNKYLQLLISSPPIQEQASKNTKGIGNKNWVMRDIYKTLIMLPPLKEQKRIVEKIEQIFSKIEQIKIDK